MSALLTPWRQPAQLARELGHVTLSMPIATVAFVIASALTSTGIGTLPVLPLGVAVLLVALGAAHLVAKIERSRIEALSGEPVADPVPRADAPTFLRRVVQRLRSGPRWREVAYCFAQLIPATVGFAVTVAVWAGSLTMLALPLLVHAFPDRTAHFWFFDLGTASAWLAVPVGLVGVFVVAPWLTRSVATVQALIARKLLGPTAEEELRARATEAESTRAAAVDAAEAERRRIERDLHDGAQQRLVALAADLGAARERAESDPRAMVELLARAHEEAKGALREIRDLVRGIHPVILEDRGLDAALSAVVARCAVPVTLDVQLDRRLPSTVESAAYFVVSEALTNVSRHARATRASVAIARAGDRLVIEVHDDGVGGADASRGTGLQGLRDRVAAMHGSITVISPPGGPTTLSVELPCGS